MRRLGLIFGTLPLMRALFNLLLLAIMPLLHGQGHTRTVATDSGRVVLHYFTTGQLSTKEWTDKDQRWGRSWAFKRDGVVIVEHQTRRIAGHASVHFEYHPNGAVSKVEVSDAPDGGIQWYRSSTTFDENGVRTGFTEQGHDDDGYIPRPGYTVRPAPTVEQPPELPMPQVQQVVECQKMFVNEVFVVNRTNSAFRLIARPIHPSPALPTATYTLAPGDTARLGTYSVGEMFEAPEEHLRLDVFEVTLAGARQVQPITETTRTSKEPGHLAHMIVINGWKKREPAEDDPKNGQQDPDTPEPSKKSWWPFWR